MYGQILQLIGGKNVKPHLWAFLHSDWSVLHLLIVHFELPVHGRIFYLSFAANNYSLNLTRFCKNFLAFFMQDDICPESAFHKIIWQNWNVMNNFLVSNFKSSHWSPWKFCLPCFPCILTFKLAGLLKFAIATLKSSTALSPWTYMLLKI